MLTANEHRDTHTREYLKAGRRAGYLICLLSAAIVLAIIGWLTWGAFLALIMLTVAGWPWL